MQGLERSENFFREYGLPLFEKRFPELLPDLAAGVAGRGSECFGFDDELSEDHDFAVGFTLWLEDDVERARGFELQRAYDALIKEHFPHSESKSSKLGPSEHGVVRICDFYRRHTGLPDVPRTWQEWLYTPEYAFAEAVNGKVFIDHAGVFSRIRNVLLYDMPEDVRLKKIASRLISMAQSGQYNFERCLKHGEPGAAAMALCEFVKNAVSLLFLFEFRFAPYYKWQFRALRLLPRFGVLADLLESLLAGTLSTAGKNAAVEQVCAEVADHLRESGLTELSDSYLEPHAFEVMKRIRSAQIRGLHVMEG